MSDSEIAYFLQLTKNELINKEKDNVQTRCNVVNREVNKTIRALVGANNMLDALACLKECAVYVDVKDYTQHIDEWKGLTIPYKAKQVPTSFKAYRKAAVNWANGRRASILAIKVFPQLIAQSVQYCAYVARALFPSDNNRAESFFRLCEAAVILSILKSNVQLNQRSAETPLICQNSVIKHGFDKVLERYLPSENVPIIDIAASLLNEAPHESELTTHLIGGGVSVTTDYLVKAQKKMHQKLQSNMFGAFQKAFTDLYTSRLAQYRRLYMPTETSRTEQQPRASPSIVLQFNHWMEYIGQNLHLMPESEIHDLCRKVQQFQQSIENQITQRSFNNLQTMPLNPMNQYIIGEKAHNGYLGDCNSTTSATSVPMSLPVSTHRYTPGYLENTTIFPLMTLESKNESEINTIHTYQSQLNCNSNNNNNNSNASFCASPLYSSTVSAESEINVESTPNRKRKKSFDHYSGVSLMPNCKRARINHENNSDVFDTFVDTDSNES